MEEISELAQPTKLFPDEDQLPVIKTEFVHAEGTSGIGKDGTEAGVVIPNPVEVSTTAVAWDVAKQIGGSLSGDLLNSGLSLPTSLMEPMTILQRGVEVFEYAKCLEDAVKFKNSINRMAFVAGFFASPFASSCGRIGSTNFNPILGETFEYIDNRFDDPIQVFSEQVSHHPPMAAMQAQTKDWKFEQQYGAVTNFMVNKLDVTTDAQTHIKFTNTGDHFFALTPKVRVHNVVVGSMWLEHYGEINIKNVTTGERCVIEFAKAGFFASGPNFQISGYIFDKHGKKVVKLSGRWDQFLLGKWTIDTQDEGFKKGDKQYLWRVVPTDFTDRPYKWTNYTMTLNYFSDEMKDYVLTTDSRRRPDRQFLEAGDAENATQWKRIAEYRQRMDLQERKEKCKKLKAEGLDTGSFQEKDFWIPNWFKMGSDHQGKPFWVFSDQYWDINQKVKESGIPYVPDNIKDTAADFAAYPKNFSSLVGSETPASEPSDDKESLE